MRCTPAGNAVSAWIGRVGVRGLGVVHELDARGARDRFEPVRQRRELAQGAVDVRALDAGRPRRRRRRDRVLEVVVAAQAGVLPVDLGRIRAGDRDPLAAARELHVAQGAGRRRSRQPMSPGSWFSKMRSLQRRYSSKLPCRSRWSGVAFRSTPTRQRRVSMSSSWKLESSQAIHAPASTRPASDVSGRPTLPATSHGTPPVRSIAPSSSVVVVFPFVPVTPAIGLGSIRAAKLDLAPDRHARGAGRFDLVGLRRNPRALHHRIQSFHGHNVTPEDGFDTDLAKPPHVDVAGRVGRDDLRLGPHAPNRLTRRDSAPRQPDDQIPLTHDGPKDTTTLTGTSRRRGSRGRSRSHRRSPP